MTVALGTALYSLVLAVGRDPLPTLSTTTPPRLLPPPSPQRLEPVPETAASSKFVDDDRTAARTVAVPVRITLQPGQLLPQDAGVATFDSDTGAEFRWFPVSEMRGGDESHLTVSAAGSLDRNLTVTFAANLMQARHGYWSRKDVRLEAAPDGRAPTVELSGRVTQVALELPPECARIGPLRLGRADDPQWVVMGHDRIGLTIARDEPLSVSLGDGVYELSDPLTSQHTQRFSVPETTHLTVDVRLQRAATDRR